MKTFSKAVLIGIILLATVLRFLQLEKIPEGFHADEAAFGYNAYSIMKTGKDEYGKPFPLILKSFSDYKGAVYAYITIPFIYVAGLNEWSVRAPSALFGVLFVILTYALVYQLSKNYKLSVLSMLLASISPLGILLSRVQSDPLVCVFFFYLGYYCWLLWSEKKNIFFLFSSIASFVVSFYTYPATRLFVLPFFLLVGLRSWPLWSKRVRFWSVITFLGIGVIVGAMSLSSAGTRLTQISIFSKMDVQLPLEEGIREDGMVGVPIPVTRFFHNKVSAYGQFFLDNFTSYLSYDFLFRQASEPIRERIPNSGVLLLIELPFLIIGIYAAIRKRLSYAITSILWFLSVPLVLSIASDETPNIHRFFLAVIPIHILVAQGVVFLYDTIRARYRSLLVICISLLFFLNVISYMHKLFVHQPTNQPVFRNNAHKDLALTLKSVYPLYDVIVSQKILEHMLFFWPIDPSLYQLQRSPRDFDNAWYDKFLFVNDACPSKLTNPSVSQLSQKRILYVDLSECTLGENMKVVKSIYYKNTLEAFRLVSQE